MIPLILAFAAIAALFMALSHLAVPLTFKKPWGFVTRCVYGCLSIGLLFSAWCLWQHDWAALIAFWPILIGAGIGTAGAYKFDDWRGNRFDKEHHG